MEELQVKADDIPPDPEAARTSQLPQGMKRVWDAKSKTWVTVNARLASTTIMEQFRDELFPERPQMIEIGSKVYVKPLKVEGTVARITQEGTLRVDVKGATQTFWPLECEPLPSK
jgi:hypothetical protein